MKKRIAVGLVAVMVATLVGCGNMSIGPGKFTFHRVHVDTYHNSGCFTIEKWYNGETGIEVKTKEAGSMFLSEGTYVLVGEEICPLCGSGGEA